MLDRASLNTLAMVYASLPSVVNSQMAILSPPPLRSINKGFESIGRGVMFRG